MLRILDSFFFDLRNFTFKFGFDTQTHIIGHFLPTTKLQYDNCVENDKFGFLQTVFRRFAQRRLHIHVVHFFQHDAFIVAHCNHITLVSSPPILDNTYFHIAIFAFVTLKSNTIKFDNFHVFTVHKHGLLLYITIQIPFNFPTHELHTHFIATQ